MYNKMSQNKKDVIQIGSKIYSFPRLPFETDQSYFSRRKYIIKASPTTSKKFAEATRLSMVWSNIEFLGCTYSETLTRETMSQLSSTNA